MPITSKALKPVVRSGPHASQSNPSFIGGGSSFGGLFGIGTTDNLGLYQSWTWACVDAIAEALAGLDVEVSAFDPVSKERVPAEAHHWLVNLLRDPNPEIDPTTTWSIAARWYLLNGNAYLYAPRYDGNVPQEIWVLPSNRVTVVPGVEGAGRLIQGYIYSYDGGRQFIDADDIVHWKFLDPSSDTSSTLYTGRSPINAARSAIQVDVSNQEFLASHYANGAIPAFVITQTNPMDPHTFETFKARWNQSFGGARNAGKWGLLDGGKNIQVLSSGDQVKNAAALDDANRKRVCSVWRVPEMLITGDYNARAVSENVTVNFHRDNVAPKAKRLAEALTRMARRFDSATDPVVRFLPYTYSDPAEVRAERESWAGLGVPLNVLRVEEGLDEIPGAEAPSELRTTVGGATSFVQLQVHYSQGNILREAAIATAMLLYDFSRVEAEGLFPAEGTASPLAENAPDDEPDEVTEADGVRYAKGLDADVARAYWKRYDDPAEETTDRLAEIIGQVYREIGEDVVQEFLRQNPVETAPDAKAKDVTFTGEFFDSKALQEMLEELTEEELEEFIRMTGYRAIEDAGSSTRYRESFDRRVGDLTRRSTSKITTSVGTVKEQLQELLRKHRRESPEKVAARIQSRFKHYSEAGARTIARTTATFATGAAQSEAWNTLQTNDPTIQSIERVWLTQRDSKVRDSHRAADGQIAGPDGTFIVGGATMWHPGDGNDAGEAANCRCVTRPRIKRDPNATDPNAPGDLDQPYNPDDLDPLDMFELGQL